MPAPKPKPNQTRLPTPLSSFIGRGHEIAEVGELLLENRLVTLTGPGGAGKTRLALEVANKHLEEFEDGVWLTELASLADASLVPQAVASTLGVHEQLKQVLAEDLVHYLRNKHALLVLDNCEHLVDACAELVENLLQNCPKLWILATSREGLNIQSEITWTVPPLSLPVLQPWREPASQPQTLPDYLQSEAIQLFVTRARTVTSDFTLTGENGRWVAEICRQLDGIPLAIELAAARVRALSVDQIAERLDDRFHLLTSGSRTAPARQQTLAAALDWSYALLEEIERKILQRLSIFAGGATLEAAEAVCGGEEIDPYKILDGLSRLVDKSLVVVERPESGETRYRLLETIRQYAKEKLIEAGETEVTKDRHLDYFIQWAEEAEPHLNGVDQLPWLVQYEAEHDNLRAALEWSRSDPVKGTANLRLAAASGRFWRLHGYLSEGRARLTTALTLTKNERTIHRARALTYSANLAYLRSEYPDMHPLVEEALSIWREIGKEGKEGMAFTLDLLGELSTEEGDYVSGRVSFKEAIEIYRELNDLSGESDILMQFGWAAIRTGDYPHAEQHLEEFLNIARKMDDKTRLTYALSGLGEVALREGQIDRAISLLEQGLELSREHGDKWGTGTLLGSLGWVALRQKDFKQMRKVLRESLAIRMEISNKGGIAWCLEKLGEAAELEGEPQKAVNIFGCAAALRSPIGSVIDPADQPDYERVLAELRTTLGVEAFETAWSEGEVMELDDAIELALSGPEATTKESSAGEKEKYGGLTTREREAAVLIAEGKSNREIAEAMVVGVRTVETYVTRILGKLNFDSRVQIATWAVERGLTASEKE
jgi:predicted ATPase/DNA-binding CsgD family transcriptional regulator